jgi:hypothetical protein
LFTCPETHISRVPPFFGVPSEAYHSAPLRKIAGTDALKLIAELNPLESDNDEILLRRLAPFLLAGLLAPLPDLSDVTRELDGELARRQ